MKTPLRILLVLCGIVLATAVIIALWYAEENYRGARHWAEVRRDLEKCGESFDPAHHIPPMVPDEQNLAMAPLFVRLYQYRVHAKTGLLTFHQEGNKNAAKTLDDIPFGKNGAGENTGPGWLTARPADLSKVQRYYRARNDFPHPAAPASAAEEVLTALTRFQPLLDELEGAAASRPVARFPVNWTQKPTFGLTPSHENALQKLVSLLRLRACAELATGQPEAALREIRLGFRLGNALAAEPLLIGSLVEVTCVGIIMEPVWEGLQTRCWNAAQLADLQAVLSGNDLLASHRRSLQAERVLFALPMLDYLHEAKDFTAALALLEGRSEVDRVQWARVAGPFNRLFPRGWYDEAKAVVSDLDQRYIIDPIQPELRRVDMPRIEAGIHTLRNLPSKLSTIMAKSILTNANYVTVKVARGQSTLDQAITACALERFYLDHQTYPASLDALVPAYLAGAATDLIDGAPMRYERTPTGRYRLWSMGWNGQDEGGKIKWQPKTHRPDDRRGDWVWQYAPVELPELPPALAPTP